MAYDPQSNGMVERANGHLRATLRTRLADVEWPDHLAWVLLGLRLEGGHSLFCRAGVRNSSVFAGKVYYCRGATSRAVPG